MSPTSINLQVVRIDDQVPLSDGPIAEVSLTMRAAPNAIWEACTDPTLPLENSPELLAAHWDPEGPPPGVGARLIGVNRMGDREWTSTATVVTWEPMGVWSYAVGDTDAPASQWWYEMADHGDGTVTVTQRVRLGPGPSGLKQAVDSNPDAELKIIRRRLEYMATPMKANLEAIEARAAS